LSFLLSPLLSNVVADGSHVAVPKSRLVVGVVEIRPLGMVTR